MIKAVLLTGGNLGDVSANMIRVRELIAERLGRLVDVSTVFESEPWGFNSANSFQNQVLVVETEFTPFALLKETQGIEREFGHKMSVEHDSNGERVYHSRQMDIDILFYGSLVIETPELIVPHPRIPVRDFVLRPLCEVAGEMIHPVIGESINSIKNKYDGEIN